NPFENSTLESLGYLDEGDLSKLKELGVVGDIGFRFFNEMGNKVDNPFSKKMVGLSLEDLKNIKKVIAVVSGVYKADALLAMLRGGYIDILVTDEATANAVL